MFNHKGVCRFPGLKNTIVGKLIPDEPVPKKKKSKKKTPSKAKPVKKLPKEATPEEVSEEAEEEISVEYERQGEQVITVDDIVIEGLDE